MSEPSITAPTGYKLASRECFVCGQPGVFMWGIFHCNNHESGGVTWSQFEKVNSQLPREVYLGNGKIIKAVDFTNPNALGSPA